MAVKEGVYFDLSQIHNTTGLVIIKEGVEQYLYHLGWGKVGPKMLLSLNSVSKSSLALYPFLYPIISATFVRL